MFNKLKPINSVLFRNTARNFTITADSPNDTEVYGFDHEGRLISALINRDFYRRSLMGWILKKQKLSNGLYRFRKIPLPESENLLNQINNRVLSFENSFLISKSNQDLSFESCLKIIKQYFTENMSKDISRFSNTYRSIGIIPPDHYLSVLLQATNGCSFNQCSFCNFYKSQRFHVKSTAEFRKHTAEIKSFLGKGITARKNIFLGEANALTLPENKLLSFFEIIQSTFDLDQIGGIYAFLDGFSGKLKSPGVYNSLSKNGLKGVYIGMESGHDPLLKEVNKPSMRNDVITTVHNIKQAGIPVSIIILLGLGGKNYAKMHIADTITAVNQMNLGMEDTIYFSELIADDPISLLSSTEMKNQQFEIEKGFHFSSSSGTPHISKYSLLEFVY